MLKDTNNAQTIHLIYICNGHFQEMSKDDSYCWLISRSFTWFMINVWYSLGVQKLKNDVFKIVCFVGATVPEPPKY